MRLSVNLLGGFQVLQNDRMAVFATDRSRALLAYLSVEADYPHRRETLASLVWPDRPESLARKNFSQTFLRVRRAIGDHLANPAIFLITPQTIQLNSQTVDLDVAQFQALLKDCAVHPHLSLDNCPVCLSSLEKAASLYRGDFLQGLSISDSQSFEEWMRWKREQYHHQALNALQMLAAYALERGEFEQARVIAERQLSLEPWQEEAYHQLMQAMAFSGQRSLALIMYRNYCRIMFDELGVEPAPAIVELYERIRLGQLFLPGEA